MFDAKDVYMYVMTERGSQTPATLELNKIGSGYDIGLYCRDGNLGRERIRKDSILP